MTIPASTIVAVTPAVLEQAGAGLDLNGIALSTSTRVPTGTVEFFPTAAAVSAFFGPSSGETAAANVYFLGYDNSPLKPGSMGFAQYNQTAVAAYERGGNISQLSLSALQALTGTLSIVMDGYARSGGTISLSAASSFSSAATIIATALNTSLPTEASVTSAIGASFTGAITATTLTVSAIASNEIISVGDTVVGGGVSAGTKIVSQLTGPIGGNGTYQVNNSQSVGSESMTTTSNVLNVTAVGSGTVAAGQTVTGSSVAASTVLTSQLSGTAGGIGTYAINGAPQTVTSEAMTLTATAVAVTFDSVSGGFVITSGATGVASTAAFATGTLAAPLLLTSATGAVLSQGAAAATPAAFMSNVAAFTQNWATFFTLFDPDGGTGFTQKEAFATWTNGQNNRYAYIPWDTDMSPRTSLPATGSFGYAVQQAGLSGTALISELTDQHYAAFASGSIASIDFLETNGRTTLKFRSQSGLVADVTDATTAANLAGNGYNYYGAYATANQNFNFFANGVISGPFQWIDSYINQIWMNNNFQLALMQLLTAVGSIPYNPAGFTLIEQALQDPINAALNFGAIRAGVTLSSAEIAEVNNAAGIKIDTVLSTRGWYLQVNDPGATVRQLRGSPVCRFWYMDGESVQMIDLSSILVQ